MERRQSSSLFWFRGAIITFALFATMDNAAHADSETESSGAVYVLSNQPSGNSVLVYSRSASGNLKFEASYPTGGKGAGTGTDPLGSQGSLTLGSGYLFAVNAGSNDVSMFAVDGTRLTLLDREPSGGQMPVSVAVKGFDAYVVNAAGREPNINGYLIDAFRRRLVPLPNSRRALAGGANAQPAQVGFTADGDEILVTEKGTQLIDTFKVGVPGYTTGPRKHPSNGVTPFGFSVTNRGYDIVAEAGSGTVSSYEVEDNGHLTTISRSVPLGQNAPCWLVTTGDGRFGYTANAGSQTISSLKIGADGTTRVLNATAAALTAPFDLALTKNSKFLYVREGNGAITGFRVSADGTLSPIGSVTGLPAGAQGIAAR
ncbi:lactonase family protein [Paraburkholderia rhizosphaerae]|uniref:6-phosphogluconolactonase (Cycloisomerase 2 family) n=1 Tax=Paraburkholderia rhizosphaerae TaxID=480658 RepID=A0A4R8L5D8_9BURK|nr:beta-propeller fold lactonase family protein [Paraburkholderia rhizosphaerae]TDY37852.1 6-phosphogluconolactonase (cycloisomerase 2 family) [Paraburkholderia rhizosphaerae]